MRTQRALVAVALLLAACGSGEPEEQQAVPDTAPAAAAPATVDTATAAPASAVTDPQIADIVVAANEVDIQAGEMARARAADPRVKAFAERMITDHTGVNKAASDLVGKLGVTPEPSPTSTQLRDGGASTRQTLGAKSGADFDRAYMDSEITYHQAVLDAIDQTLIPGAQNAELKALLEQTRPAIDAHLQHAREIRTALGQG
ncbi:MAG: DUF4142 domain-containing protein [Longimicrobiaceae bacterium]